MRNSWSHVVVIRAKRVVPSIAGLDAQELRLLFFVSVGVTTGVMKHDLAQSADEGNKTRLLHTFSVLLTQIYYDRSTHTFFDELKQPTHCKFSASSTISGIIRRSYR